MYLCHKCSGILAYSDDENITDLLQCGCISGYYRGSEPARNRAQAIKAQITALNNRINLYTQQGRPDSEILPTMETLIKMERTQ